MREVLKMAALAAFLAVSAFAIPSTHAVAQEAVPDLTGTWSGQGTGGVVFGKLGHQDAAPEPRFKDRSVTWTLTIDQQDGTGLIGTWNSPNATERLIGVVRADGQTIHLVDEDTYFDAILRSDDEMEVCLREAGGSRQTGGGSMVATCYILRRQ